MIIEIPDKQMVVEFPDDMDPKEVERQIYKNVYDQDVISEAPEQSLFEKGKQFAGDIKDKVVDTFTTSPEERVFEQYGAYPDFSEDPEQLPAAGEELPPIAKPYEEYTKPYTTNNEPLSRIPEEDRQEILSNAQKLKPEQDPEKTVLSYVPFVAVKALQGLMAPALPALKTMGMDTEGLLTAASEYWGKKLPEVGVPNAGIGVDENGDYEIQRLDDYPLSEIVGGTAEGVGLIGPASQTLKAGGLVAEKLSKYARPFYQSVVKGMVGGALLGEGKKDETLMNMAMFGMFEAAGYAIAKIPQTAKAITDSNMYRKATIKERGLVVQDLETTLKQNPGMSEADLVKTSDVYFQEALARRRVPEGQKPIEKPAATGEPVPADVPTAKPLEPVQPGAMTAEEIQLIKDPTVKAFSQGRMSVEPAPVKVAAIEPAASKEVIKQEIPEKRVDVQKRKKVSEMSPEELQVELLTDYKTGLGNQRAYDESAKKELYTSVDVDGLKWVNDNLGHDVGDALIANVGEAFKQPGLESYHQSGDEFSAQSDSQEQLDNAMIKADNYLKANPIEVTLPDGTKKLFTGSFSHGTAKDIKTAEKALGEHKREREVSGERYTRGSEPTRFLKERPTGNGGKSRGKAGQDVVGEKTTPKKEAPIKLYHGTTKLFKKFDPSKGELGSHFGSKSMAKEFSGKSKQGRIVEAEITINNPYDIVSDLGDWNDMGMLEEHLAEANEGPFSDVEFSKFKNSRDVRNGLIKKGYDGITYQNEFEGQPIIGGKDAYIVFSSEQIDTKKPTSTSISGKQMPPKKKTQAPDPLLQKVDLIPKEKKGETFYSKEEPTAESTKPFKPKKPLITEAQQRASNKKKTIKETQLKIESAQDAKKAVHSMVRQRRYDLNLSSYKTNKFINDIEQVTTRQQREIIPFIIEKTPVPKKLKRPDLEKAYAESKDDLSGIAKQVKDHFDKGWKNYKEHIGDMSAVEIENYVTHIWEVPRSKKQEVTNWFTTKNRFAKERYIDTLEKGINELGLKPKVLDIGEIIQIHDSATNKAIQNKKLVDDLIKLKKDGAPLIERIDKAPQDWPLINHPALNKAVFIPGESKMGEKITPELENILYEMGVAIGRRISPVNFGKPSKVAGLYKMGDPPEVRFQRFMKTKTIAHEIGHHIDTTLGLGDEFLNKHKTELYALNKERIEKSGLEKSYTTKTSEQIAEAFAFLFTDPKMMTKVAPTVMTDMLDKLKKDGAMSKLVDYDFEKKAKNLIEEQLNTLTKLPVRVHPDLLRPLKVVFESTDSGEIMKAYDSIAGVLKKTSLSLSLFHHLALGETGIATTSPGKVAGIYFNPVKIYKALAKGEYDVFKKEDIAKDAIGHGLQMGATSDIPVQKIQGYLNDFAAKTKNTAVIGRITEFLRTFNEKWDAALWDYLHDSLKLYAYESLAAKNVDPTKDVKKQKEEVAQLVNDTFGGQNWDVLMITPKEVQLMTRMLLSADWTTSTARQALAPTGIGKIHNETKLLRKKMGRMFWMKAALYFGAGVNMLNYTFREADRKKNPEYYKNRKNTVPNGTMYGNAIGHKTHLFVGRYEDGTERYIRWGKQFRELPEMLMDDTGFSPVSASIKKMGGKANPMMQLASQITTGHSMSGFKNDDISGKKGWDKTWGIAKTILKSPLPFSSRTLLTPNKEFHITDIAMPSSKGMSRYKAMSLFKTAIIKKDDRFLKEIYQDTLENNLPAYTLFNAALTSLKAEETRGYNKTLKDLKGLKEHAPVKTPKEAAILKRKIKRLIKEKVDKDIGLKMLGKAIIESKKYNLEKGE